MKSLSLSRPSRSILLRAFGTLVALALLVYLLSQQGWDQIGDAFSQIPAWRLFLAMGLMMVSRLAVSARWYVLLRSAKTETTFWEVTRVTFAGLFSSNFLPTTIGGDVIRLAGAIQLKYDAAISAASLIADRLIGMAGMAMAVPFGLPTFMQPGALQDLFSSTSTNYLVGFVSLPAGSWWQKTRTRGMSLFRRLLNALSLWLKQPRTLLVALIFSWVNMICLFGVLAVLFTGMGEQISFWLVGGLYSIVYFVTLLPVSINGYGLQEISMTFVFSHLGGAAVGSGLTAALLFRTMMMIASLPGAFFVPGMITGAKNQPEAKDQPEAQNLPEVNNQAGG